MIQTADGRMFRYSGGGFGDVMPALLLSFAIHLALFFLLYAYAEYWAPVYKVNKKQEVYAVHLTDPGEIMGAPGIGKSSIVEAAPPQEQKIKTSVEVEKKLIPITKDQAGETKKTPKVKKVSELKKATLEKTITKRMKEKAEAEKLKAESVAREVKHKKGGGMQDIKGFPYTFYLRSIDNKIYTNWDVLKLNVFSEKTIKAEVVFEIDRNGNVIKTVIEDSSFNKLMDSSAIDAVRRSSPFPPLPAGYKEDTLVVHFGFTVEPQH
jgi:TonB family protein